ncbi:RbsD/FucU family protein [Boudabousia marimammalium]|uniref:Fucose isomerase n=1 Tax=Boudabousia marimammalium TaxID=156892 RepID=A0A1Q5PSL1_9ACTO|nr:RbsD/FucU domain-containing protein [Boudabousia marimammalium]OKL50435.1 fucose isomerase [Boudabousia marimammalium]
MLKNIDPRLSPELLMNLAEMGHGDEIVIADGNFPGASVNPNCLRYDTSGVPNLLEAVLSVLPLDPYSDWQYGLMETVGDDPTPPIWSEYKDLVEAAYPGATVKQIERFEFYERARQAFAVVVTGETALYANIILKKGVVTP